MRKFIPYLYILIVILTAGLTSCKKNVGFSKGNLSFSVDTVVFDTVFTTIGSTTQNFKIYNKESKPIVIEEIELAGGENSPFRINIDGISGDKHTNVEILANDSLYAFVEVTLKVNGQNLPLVIEDSIRFRTNGKDQYVHLAVWGQDAYFHYEDSNEGTWQNDKPHVIYNRAYVYEGKTLNIQPNTKVYLHKNSMLFVYKGTLNVAGTKAEPVIFQGDRLEQFYKNVAGQWYGIYFHESLESTINYAIIKNGTAGLHLTGNNANNPSSAFNVKVSNTKIFNHASYGIFLYDGSKIKVENSVIAKNGAHAIFILRGASYDFNHCQILGYGSGDATPAFAIRNHYDGYYSGVPFGKITNSVIYGNQTSEIVFDTVNLENDPTLFNFEFKRCLIKLETPSTNSMFQDGIIWNSNPMFTNINEYNFKPLAGSPLSNLANPAFYLPADIDSAPRPNPGSDIGAYEF